MAEFPTTPIDDEQLGAVMLYSSGTTGQPKGILRPLPDVAPGAALPIMGFVQLMFRFREGQTYLSPRLCITPLRRRACRRRSAWVAPR